MSEDKDRGTKALSAAVDALMEYFDTVQIFVTKDKSEEMTVSQMAGKGNLFARFGQVYLWLPQLQNALMQGDGNNDEAAIPD